MCFVYKFPMNTLRPVPSLWTGECIDQDAQITGYTVEQIQHANLTKQQLLKAPLNIWAIKLTITFSPTVFIQDLEDSNIAFCTEVMPTEAP